MSMIQRVTPEQIERMPGRPSVDYELDRPPYTRYRWDGEKMVELGSVSGAWNSATPTGYYQFALRASQAGSGSPLDQSGKFNDPVINAVLFPPVRLNSTAYALGVYRSPAVLTGKLYKCTTAGNSAAAEPAAFATANIGDTINDGTAVWTVERGPWHTAASGFRHLVSIENGAGKQLAAGVMGSYTLPAINFDLANNDSCIIRLRMAFNGNAIDARTALAESGIFGNRHVTTNRRGFSIGATGSSFNSLKLFISDGTTTVASGHVATNFNRKPLDGNIRDVVFMFDGVNKLALAWFDGVSPSQAEMFDAANKTPHQLDLSPISGSTQSPHPIMFGSLPGSSSSVDFGIMALDMIVLPGRALPPNTQAIADFYFSRGAAALLPASLLL